MIHNRNYIGEYHYNNIVIPGGVPAIVPQDIFESAGKRMEGNKHASARNKAKEKYILTTKLFCGECKTMLVGESGVKRSGTYRYYKCASAKRHECKLKPIRKNLIEDFVIRKAMESISDEETVDKIIEQILKLFDEENVVIPALERQLNDVQKAIDNMVKAIEMGVCTRSTKARLEELEAEEDKLKKDIEQERVSQPTLTEEQLRFFLDRYKCLDVSVQKNREKIVDDLIGSIVLYGDGRLIITFNYRNEPVQTTIDEILAAANNGSDMNGLASPPEKPPLLRWLFWW